MNEQGGILTTARWPWRRIVGVVILLTLIMPWMTSCDTASPDSTTPHYLEGVGHWQYSYEARVAGPGYLISDVYFGFEMVIIHGMLCKAYVIDQFHGGSPESVFYILLISLLVTHNPLLAYAYGLLSIWQSRPRRALILLLRLVWVVLASPPVLWTAYIGLSAGILDMWRFSGAIVMAGALVVAVIGEGIAHYTED